MGSSAKEDVYKDGSQSVLQRRDLLRAGIGLAVAGLPLCAAAGGHKATMPRYVPPLPPASPNPLIIESFELFWLHDGTKMGAGFPRLMVRVRTQEGVVGEAYTFFWHSWDRVIEIIQQGIEPLLKGMDAMNVEACWQRAWLMLDLEFARGEGSSIMPQFQRALAAIDAALWDAVGKALNAPCYQMWGAHSNELPVVSFDMRYRHPGNKYDPVKFGEKMARLPEMGFAGVKLKPGRPPYTPAEDAVWVRQVRDVCGPDFLIQADANLRWEPEDAIDFGKRVDDIDLRWLEEPCRTRRDMARVRAATGLTICAGQSEVTIDGARYLMTDDAIDVCNYDPGYGGGPTAWRKIYGLAQAFGVEMSVHQQPQVAGHLMAATPDGVKHGIEVYMRDQDPFFYQMIENQGSIKDGIYTLPDGPGFGFVYDEQVVKKFRHEV